MLKKRFSINIQYGVILCLLFLAAINFMAKFFYFAYAAMFAMMFFLRKLKMNAISVVYLALGLLMTAFYFSENILLALKPISFCFLYLVGLNIPRSNLARKGGKQEADVAYQLLFAVALGSFAHLMLNYVLNLGRDLGRNTVDIWSGVVQSATGQAALGSIMIGLAPAMILSPVHKHSRIFGIVASVLIMAYNLTLAGRTLLALFLICAAVGGVFVMKHFRLLQTKRVKLLSRAVLVLAILVAVYATDLAGIRSLVEKSNLYVRFFGEAELGLWETGRWDQRQFFLKNMLKYPFGGLHMREQFGYAHDLLLDAYDEYGIFTLVPLLFVLADGIRQLYRFCRNDDHKLSHRTAFLCAYVAILLEFCLEPIFAGMPWLFACYSLINGALACINRAAKDKKTRMMEA